MIYYVEARAKPGCSGSTYNVYSVEWETPTLEACTFDVEHEAVTFCRDCDKDDAVKVHQYRVRRGGENHGFFQIN